MRSRSIVLAFLVACGGGGKSDKVLVDASNAKLVAVQHDGAWQALTPGPLDVQLDGPTIIAVVCQDATYFDYYTFHTGPGADDLDLHCSTPLTSFTVTVMAPATTKVFIDFTSTFSGNTMLDVTGGLHDIVAIDTTLKRFEIRRQVAISANETIKFDLTTAGDSMIPVAVSAMGAGQEETISRFHNVRIGTTIAYWSSATAEDLIIPPAALEGLDRQSISVSTSSELMGSR
jgi:hypothetical protein